MRGEDRTSGALFSYVDIEARIREASAVGDAAADRLGFRRFTSGSGTRPSRRSACCGLRFCSFSIRSARSGNWATDMLFRWFVGLSIDENAFDASTFSKNRDRLLTHEVAQVFLSSLLGLPAVKGLLSAEHLSVDGTLLKAWASMKSFRPKAGSGDPPSPGRKARLTSARPSARTRRTPR